MDTIISLLASGWLLQLLYGSLITIALSVCNFVVGTVVALFFISFRIFPTKPVNILERICLTIVSGLPELLIIFFVFYCVSNLSNHLGLLLGVTINSYFIIFASGSIALGFICGMYLVSALRSGLNTLDYGQIEVALSMGMGKLHILSRIVLPQIIGKAFNNIINIWLLVLKDSSLVMAIGLAELTYKSNMAVTTTDKPFLFYGLAGAIYLVISSISVYLLNKLKFAKHYRKITNA